MIHALPHDANAGLGDRDVAPPVGTRCLWGLGNGVLQETDPCTPAAHAP